MKKTGGAVLRSKQEFQKDNRGNQEEGCQRNQGKTPELQHRCFHIEGAIIAAVQQRVKVHLTTAGPQLVTGNLTVLRTKLEAEYRKKDVNGSGFLKTAPK